MGKFLRGVSFAFKGISCFYSDKTLWKYVAAPWGLLLLFYGGCFYLTILLSNYLAAHLAPQTEQLPAFLKTLLEGGITLFLLLLTGVAAITFLSTFFEIFGALFFDKLIERFEEKYYGTSFPSLPLKTQIRFTLEGAWYGIKTTLIFAVLLVAGIFLPLLLPVLLALVMGYRMANALLFAPGFLRGKGIRETQRLFRQRFSEVAGFGIAVYCLQLLPLLFPLLLPGMILGASMLYNGTDPENQELMRLK